MIESLQIAEFIAMTGIGGTILGFVIKLVKNNAASQASFDTRLKFMENAFLEMERRFINHISGQDGKHD